MKKIFTYIAVLAALLTVSCNNVEINEMPAGDETFTISLCSADLQTRAEEKQTAQEKAIDHFDWFFFKDAEGTQLLKHGRQTGSSKTFQTADGQEFAALSGTSYFYAIANYPETITATDGRTKLSDLLNLPVKVGIASHPATPFVMDSYDKDKNSVLVKLAPVRDREVRTQTVWMRRVAAKFVVNITVASSVTVGTGADAHIWKPTTTTQDFYMYMVNSFVDAEGTKLTGTPTDIANISEATKFYTYNHKHADLTKTNDNNLEWISASYYSYPVKFATTNQKMPYFKVQLPWVHVNDASLPAEGSNIGDMGTHVFYYKVMLPEITEITRNTLYTLNLTLDKVGGTQEDYIVTTTDLKVTNWLTPSGQFTGYYSARFLDCARDVYEFYGTDNMEIPVTSSHPISVNVTSASKITFNSTTGAEVTTPVTDYTATANGKSSFNIVKTLHNDITQTNVFDYTPITYEVEITHEDGHQPHTETVTVIQYPPIYVAREESNGYAYVNSYAHGNRTGGRHTSSPNYYAYNSRGTSSSGSDALGSMNWLGQSGSQNNNANQYIVTVSVLPEGYTVPGLGTIVIGDPRGGRLTNNYLGYSGFGDQGARNLNVQSQYNAVSNSTQNVIAPQIRIASSWGATTTISYIQRAEERCAAYQENGYPAGRWRLPTVAEIDFIIRLSTYQYIPELFTTSKESTGGWDDVDYYSGYWANGPVVYLGKPYTDDGNTAPFIANSSLSATNINSNGGYLLRSGSYYNYRYYEPHVRCVYDQWFWGEEKYNNNGQKITSTSTGNNANPATRWIGYIY